MRLSALLARPVDPDPDITGLTDDSRAVAPGFLFAALPGARRHGGDYIEAALAGGACAILSDRKFACDVPVITDVAPQAAFAHISARFHGRQPHLIAGVTGTNGKTSTVHFLRQIWQHAGRSAASLGTLGLVTSDGARDLQYTTPPPPMLYAILRDVADAGIDHLAMEVSSHAIAQARVAGISFRVAAFSNLTRDHLDYHADMTDYRRAKLALFARLLADDGVAVINADGPGAHSFAAMARARGVGVIMTGSGGDHVRISNLRPVPDGLSFTLTLDGECADLSVPVMGAFQAENMALAAGMARASGLAPQHIVRAMPTLRGAPGRMETVGTVNGAGVIVDYAHTPDAVETALKACRAHTRGKLFVVLGAGGDRDREKRPLMGAAAHAHADHVIITDDNPRTEDAASIRAMVRAGAPDSADMGDRARAIAAAIDQLSAGDILLIAGKGHETGQTIGDQVLPFDDRAVARDAMARRAAAPDHG